MKFPIQFTPALTAALLCAAGWFGFWLFAFRPIALQPAVTAAHPEAVRLVVDDQILKKLKAPTLFALPSPEGFSGRFPEDRVELRLSLEKASDPTRYLPREPRAQPPVSRMSLLEETGIPQSTLPVPGTAPQAAIRSAASTQIFLSPELQARTGELPPLTLTEELTGTVRVNLGVLADGRIEYAFFDSPQTNVSLLQAVHQLPFRPADKKTDGWIDIRFPEKEKQ